MGKIERELYGRGNRIGEIGRWQGYMVNGGKRGGGGVHSIIYRTSNAKE